MYRNILKKVKIKIVELTSFDTMKNFLEHIKWFKMGTNFLRIGNW